MKNIQIDNIINNIDNELALTCEFEVNPLDIKIAQLQLNLKNKIEKKVFEDLKLENFIEKFVSKDPTLNISEVSVIFQVSSSVSTLMITIMDIKQENCISYKILQGNNYDLKNFILSKKFFYTVKHIIKEINKKYLHY